MVDTGNIKNMAKKQTALTAYKYNEGCQECRIVCFYKKFIFIPIRGFWSQKKYICYFYFWFLEALDKTILYFVNELCILRKYC